MYPRMIHVPNTDHSNQMSPRIMRVGDALPAAMGPHESGDRGGDGSENGSGDGCGDRSGDVCEENESE